MIINIIKKREFLNDRHYELNAQIGLSKKRKIKLSDIKTLYKDIGSLEVNNLEINRIIKEYNDNQKDFNFSPYMSKLLSDFDIIKVEKHYFIFLPLTPFLTPLEVEED